MVDYWKTAARAYYVEDDAAFGIVYNQSEDVFYTPEGKILKVAFKECDMDYFTESTTQAVSEFLLQYYHYGQGVRAKLISALNF